MSQNFSSRQWKRKLTVVVREYCWAIAQAMGLSCCDQSGRLCWSFGFQLNSLWRLSGEYPAILNISRTDRVASQRRPYCSSVNRHSSLGLVTRQWDTFDWDCTLCDRRIHNDRASRSASSRQCACPFYISSAGFLFGGGQSITSPRSVSPPASQIWLLTTSGFSQS